ncbi:MAG: hypothetical protein ACYCW6_12355 [Candidatus Xenobia bacterium]
MSQDKHALGAEQLDLFPSEAALDVQRQPAEMGPVRKIKPEHEGFLFDCLLPEPNLRGPQRHTGRGLSYEATSELAEKAIGLHVSPSGLAKWYHRKQQLDATLPSLQTGKGAEKLKHQVRDPRFRQTIVDAMREGGLEKVMAGLQSQGEPPSKGVVRQVLQEAMPDGEYRHVAALHREQKRHRQRLADLASSGAAPPTDDVLLEFVKPSSIGGRGLSDAEAVKAIATELGHNVKPVFLRNLYASWRLKNNGPKRTNAGRRFVGRSGYRRRNDARAHAEQIADIVKRTGSLQEGVSWLEEQGLKGSPASVRAVAVAVLGEEEVARLLAENRIGRARLFEVRVKKAPLLRDLVACYHIQNDTHTPTWVLVKQHRSSPELISDIKTKNGIPQVCICEACFTLFFQGVDSASVSLCDHCTALESSADPNMRQRLAAWRLFCYIERRLRYIVPQMPVNAARLYDVVKKSGGTRSAYLERAMTPRQVLVNEGIDFAWPVEQPEYVEHEAQIIGVADNWIQKQIS